MKLYTLKTIKKDDRLISYKASKILNNNNTDLSVHKKKRNRSVVGTEDYKRGLKIAYERVERQVFLNKDLNSFITITYKENKTDVNKCLEDWKYFLKKEKKTNPDIKYIMAIERQKRGAIHFHAITSQVDTYKNDNGYTSLTNWNKGYSSVFKINDLDKNFKPFLYMFKYMTKTARIGNKFIYSSRNLNDFETITDYNYTPDLNMYKKVHTAIYSSRFDRSQTLYKKDFYEK